ncbi:MAG: hypothetical protein KKA05_05055 [Alphaproteobacteria bacterium]|nr:hypothetical protein [Alphaproteobacteria bacterium]MBU0858987.1 hypothetical protein [Alphaproteobacteria bacterium]
MTHDNQNPEQPVAKERSFPGMSTAGLYLYGTGLATSAALIAFPDLVKGSGPGLVAAGAILSAGLATPLVNGVIALEAFQAIRNESSSLSKKFAKAALGTALLGMGSVAGYVAARSAGMSFSGLLDMTLISFVPGAAVVASGALNVASYNTREQKTPPPAP